MNKQLTIRQLLDEVQKQLDGHVFNTKWLVEISINEAMQNILRSNGFEGGIVLFTKPSWGSRSSSFVLSCKNHHVEACVTLRLKQVKESDVNVFGNRFTETKWSLKALDTYEQDNNTTIANLIAKDVELTEQLAKNKQDTKEELFKVIDQIGFDRFKKLAKFYNSNSWKLDSEYEARA